MSSPDPTVAPPDIDSDERNPAAGRLRLVDHGEALALSGTCEFDLASGCSHVSAGLFRLFGDDEIEGALPGDWLMQRLPPAERDYVRSLLHNVPPGLRCEFEHRILRRDGRPRHVLHRHLAEADGQGRVVRIVSVLQDTSLQHAVRTQQRAAAGGPIR